MANSKSETFTTPVGTAIYPRLSTPDTKFDELGQYKADVAIDMEEAQPLMERLTAIFKAHTGKAPKKSENTMWIFETDDSGEETGRVMFKCRVKNKMTKKGELWDRKPAMFDAAMKQINENPYGGSTMSVYGEIYCWNAGGKVGVSLQPLGVQIIDLVSGSGQNADAAAMGFQAQDGYTAPTTVAGAMGDDSDNEAEEEEGTDVPNGDY